MTALPELIERVEQATEGSDWLNLDIYRVLGAEHFGCCYADDEIPNWTGSLDAALTLVPEDWTQGHLAWPGYDHGVYQNEAKAEIHSKYSSGGGPREIGYAATLPLALCLAALKARASLTPSNS